MPDVVRQTFIISDLHLGGVYPNGGPTTVATDRGFRICTHVDRLVQFVDGLTARPTTNSPSTELVINGDLVDFLAETDADGGGWRAFTGDEAAALAKFRAIVARDRTFFDALARYVAAGHRLVLLLGNHDIELALPAVRQALREAIGAARGGDVTLIPGDEAYRVGDALIEHGNRYDSFNVVDHERLARYAAFCSRGREPVPGTFEPPAGSRMVAEVINPIKTTYKFIDLLKPETGAVVPLLLALEPGYRSILGTVALIASRAGGAHQERDAEHGGDIASDGGFEGPIGQDIAAVAPGTPESRALDALLGEQLRGGADAFADAMPTAAASAVGSDISTFRELADRALGIARLLLSSSASDVSTRLDALWSAFRVLNEDRSFDESDETGAVYLAAAKGLAVNGIKHVIFGHTHMPKRVALPSGGWYLNSGTWADVMRLPHEIVGVPKQEGLPRLNEFVHRMMAADFSGLQLFHPTYVRLDVAADDVVVEAVLVAADGSDAAVPPVDQGHA